MIYFLFELSGLKQLKQIEPEETKTVLDSLYSILGIKDYNVLSDINDYILLSMVFKEIHKDRIADSLYASLEFLSSKMELLQAFSVVVDFHDNKSDDAVYQFMQQQLYQSFSINSLFITEKTKNIFENYFDVVRDTTLFKVTKRKKYVDPVFSRGANLHLRENIKQKMIDKIVDFSQDTDKNGWILHFSGKENSFLRENLKQSLTELGSSENPDWFWIDCDTGKTRYSLPLVEKIKEMDLHQYSDFMSSLENGIFQNHDEFNNQFDHVLEDFFIRISVYLRSYILSLKSRFLPPVIVFDNIDKTDKTGVEFIKRILTSITEGIPVLITRDNKLPEQIAEFSVSNFSVDAMPKKMLIEKLPQINEMETSADELIKSCEYHPDYLFYLSYLKTQNYPLNTVRKKEDLSRWVIKNFDPQVQRVFYVLSLTSQFYKKNQIIGFIKYLGIEDEVIDTALDELYCLNFINREHKTISILKSEIGDILKHLLKDEINSITGKLFKYLKENEEKSLYCKNGYISQLKKYLENNDAVDLLLNSLMYRLDGRDIDYVLSVIKWCTQAYSRKLRNNRTYNNFITFIRLRVALLSSDEATASNLISTLPPYTAADINYENLILQGKYHNAVKNYRTAMICLKSLLVKVEEHEEPLAVGEAYLELGLSFLGLRKLEEAKEYFAIAQEHSGRFNLTYQYIRALVMHAVAMQFIGNYSNSIRLLQDAVATCDKTGCRDWELLATFLLGRAQFELGEYEQAGFIFQQAMTIATLYSHKEGLPVFYAWLGRAYCFNGNYKLAEQILTNLEETAENLYFLAETYYFSGSVKKAKELLEKSSFKIKSETFRPSEFIKYKTGFSMLEDLSLSGAEGDCVLTYLYRSFFSLLCGLTGSENEAAADLFSITREDKLSDVDPNIHLYYLFYTLVAPEKEEGKALDRITLLSKGLKILQERASEIDSPKERRAYVTKNRWNSIMLEEAHKYKLT